jgi:hypothetical protein
MDTSQVLCETTTIHTVRHTPKMLQMKIRYFSCGPSYDAIRTSEDKDSNATKIHSTGKDFEWSGRSWQSSYAVICPERQRERERERERERTRNTTVRIAGVLVKIWTRHCPNITRVSHRYTELLRRWCTRTYDHLNNVQLQLLPLPHYHSRPGQTSTDLCIHIWRNMYF